MDEELKEVIEKRGGVPGGILVKGSEAGGGSPVNLTDLIEEEEVPGEAGSDTMNGTTRGEATRKAGAACTNRTSIRAMSALWSRRSDGTVGK